MDSAQAATGPGLLLATKLHLPGRRSALVARPRLEAALDRAAGSKLTLISAPAGFGKTTLLAEWLATAPSRRVAWVSLDQGDNDPALFWAYVIAALQSRQPGVGEQALALLRSLQVPPIATILTSLINELTVPRDDIALVLDDLHVVESRPIHDGLAFLLDHLPPRLRIIVTTRADPPLPLARLRSRGELTELRAADLRFTANEAAAFLNDVMGLRLGEDDMAALDGRAEGWIAGLQLAALSMRDQQDVSGFIRTFAGDHRYILDYLLEEVLQRQPEAVGAFLLQTSILDRLSGPLCDAVTGQTESAARLTALERGNFFLIPLDDTRQWYRYHHLFADVLRARLLTEQPDQMALLHRRASAWHERKGLTADAVRHALAAGDFARAADLVELAATMMRQNRQEATLLGWLRALPDEEIRRRPVLSAVYAGVLLTNGTLDGVDSWLQEAEQWLTQISDRSVARPVGMVVVDDEEFRRLPGSIAVLRSGIALAQGDVAGTVRNARRALEIVPADDHLYRGASAALLGLANWWSGDLEPGYRFYAEGMASLRQAGNIADTVGGAIVLADIRIAQGRLHDAMAIYQQAIQLGTGQGGPALRGTADMFVGMSELHREWNDLDAASRCLEQGAELGNAAGFPQYPWRWRVALARIQTAQGDLDSALVLLDEAEQRYVGDMHPNLRPPAAMTARLWIAQGKLSDARDWSRAQSLSADDDLSYLREYAHVTLVRLLQAQGSDDSIWQASSLLDRLLDAAERGERTGSVIEVLALQALAHQQRSDLPAALAVLDRALTLAEPEGYVRIFLDEGEPMRRLLRESERPYARQLLRDVVEPAFPAPAPATASASLPEPLTPREIEILRLIAAGLRNQEIADRLFISLPTVKRHIANAYGKLGATHRTEAMARANALGLL